MVRWCGFGWPVLVGDERRLRDCSATKQIYVPTYLESILLYGSPIYDEILDEERVWDGTLKSDVISSCHLGLGFFAGDGNIEGGM